MDQQRQSYSTQTPNSRQMRYAPQSHEQRSDISALPTIKSDTYQPLSSPTWQSPVAGSLGSNSQSRGGLNISGSGDGDGDVSMEDADPYNRHKYSSQAAQQRLSQQYASINDDSAAARRYSPMNLSPSSPHAAGQGSFASYNSQPQSSRHSPTKGYSYTSPSQNYYTPSCR